RGGDLARVETEAISEQRQHGNGGHRDQPAKDATHATFRRSGITDSNVPKVRMNPPIQITVTRRLTWIFTVAWRPSRVKSPSTRAGCPVRRTGEAPRAGGRLPWG